MIKQRICDWVKFPVLLLADMAQPMYGVQPEYGVRIPIIKYGPPIDVPTMTPAVTIQPLPTVSDGMHLPGIIGNIIPLIVAPMIFTAVFLIGMFLFVGKGRRGKK